MSFSFGVQKLPAFGSYGEFAVGSGTNQIRAQYLLTKIRPGQDGSWENQLAAQMAPWREIFAVEELSFDELIQRDLDDSRVAHDLIPYLLGETGQNARFFPPVLAVLVPKRHDRSGIAPYYPNLTGDEKASSFADIFDFNKMEFGGQVSPLGQVTYNPQRTAVVIVDGQHRAMAVLALHRQLNKSWGANAFAPYYDHIQVKPEDVAHIELPVCLLWFPELTEDAEQLKSSGIDLISVCREIFTVVNRQAKQVSKSRELLLDDEDFAAFMMRRTLTEFKKRTNQGGARIYSFAFGDSEADAGSQVMSGQLEFCSAVAIHKMHAATGFALPPAYNLTKTADVTDGRNTRNPSRPVELLVDSEAPAMNALSRRSAKKQSPSTVDAVTALIGDITDSIMLPFFDQLRPYAVHTEAMESLLEALNDATAKADPVQNKVRTLLFEGSGNRNVFIEHVGRLKEREKDLNERGEAIPPHLAQQIKYCDAVSSALTAREEEVKLKRAFLLFNIDPSSFATQSATDVEALETLQKRARAIFAATSTQAFQIGYLMAVLTQVEILLPLPAPYETRMQITKFVSKLFLRAFGAFFSVSTTKHRSLSGYVAEGRAKAFENKENGFRGLLNSTNVKELSEKQWEFFRYVVFEVVNSRVASSAVLELLDAPENAEIATRYRAQLGAVLNDVKILRQRYFESAFTTSTNAQDFKRHLEMLSMKAESDGKTKEEIAAILESEVEKARIASIEASENHLKASLGKLESEKQILARLKADGTAHRSPHSTDDELDSTAGFMQGVAEVAIVSNTLLQEPEPAPQTDDIHGKDADSSDGEPRDD
jgi:hypothetical protein